MSVKQVNLVPAATTGNFAPGTGSFDPGKIRGVILHPFDADLLSTANNLTAAARKTALQALLVNANYDSRGFFIWKLDAPTNNGENVGYETRDQLKKVVDKGTWDYVFTVEGKWEVYQMLLNFHLRGGLCAAFIDENNNLLHVETATGLAGFTLHELSVPNYDMPETGKAVKYALRIALANIDEVRSMKHTYLGFNPFHPIQGLQGVQPWVLEDVTPGGAAAGVYHIALKNADGQKLLVSKYATVLNVAAAWVVKNPNGADITVSSVAIHTSGVEKDAFILTLDVNDSDYTATNVLTISLKDVATLKTTYSIGYAETTPITVIAS